jgi:hypothetical protein
MITVLKKLQPFFFCSRMEMRKTENVAIWGKRESMGTKLNFLHNFKVYLEAPSL